MGGRLRCLLLGTFAFLPLASLAGGVVPRNSNSALQAEVRQVEPAYRDGRISRYANSDLGERLPASQTQALGPDKRLIDGISPRVCYAPEALGSYQATLDEVVRLGRWGPSV